jgi:hypothetical protein
MRWWFYFPQLSVTAVCSCILAKFCQVGHGLGEDHSIMAWEAVGTTQCLVYSTFSKSSAHCGMHRSTYSSGSACSTFFFNSLRVWPNTHRGLRERTLNLTITPSLGHIFQAFQLESTPSQIEAAFLHNFHNVHMPEMGVKLP